MMCPKCGGLVPQPNMTYGWGGKWCTCQPTQQVVNQQPNQIEVITKAVKYFEQELTKEKINSLIQEIKQEPVSNNERNYALKKLLELKEKL